MALHSYHRLWVHAIWATKQWEKSISHSIEKEVHSIIVNKFKEMGCSVRIINGIEDHIHCLFLMPPTITVADIMKNVKAYTTYYINQNKLTYEKFSWQRGYAVFSVSDQGMETLINYIRKQKAHHQARSFNSELNSFLRAHGLNIDGEIIN